MTERSFLGEFEQMVLLGILRERDQAFALEVRREIEARTGRDVSRGAFYTTLDRLERKGYVRWEKDVPRDSRGRRLRRFDVTEEGLEALRTSWTAMGNLARGLEELLEGT